MNQKEKIKEVFAMSYAKDAKIVDLKIFRKLIDDDRVSAYIMRDGLLSNGDSFAQIRIIIKKQDSVP